MISITHSINLQLQGLVIWHCWMLILQNLPDARMWANRSGTVSEWTAACVCPGTPHRGSGLRPAAEHCKRMQLHQSTAGISWKCSLNSHTCRQHFPHNKYGNFVSVVTSCGPQRWCSSRSPAAMPPLTWISSSGGQIRVTVFQQIQVHWVSVVDYPLSPFSLSSTSACPVIWQCYACCCSVCVHMSRGGWPARELMPFLRKTRESTTFLTTVHMTNISTLLQSTLGPAQQHAWVQR